MYSVMKGLGIPVEKRNRKYNNRMRFLWEDGVDDVDDGTMIGAFICWSSLAMTSSTSASPPAEAIR